MSGSAGQTQNGPRSHPRPGDRSRKLLEEVPSLLKRRHDAVVTTGLARQRGALPPEGRPSLGLLAGNTSYVYSARFHQDCQLPGRGRDYHDMPTYRTLRPEEGRDWPEVTGLVGDKTQVPRRPPIRRTEGGQRPWNGHDTEATNLSEPNETCQWQVTKAFPSLCLTLHGQTGSVGAVKCPHFGA